MSTTMGLDVTERARILPEHVAALAARAASATDPTGTVDPDGTANPVVRFVTDALRFYFEFHAGYDGFYGAFIHDPLVVACALDPDLVRTEPAAVDVDAAGGLGDGQTIADWRGLWGRVPNADVAVEAEAGEFLRRFVERVGTLAGERAHLR